MDDIEQAISDFDDEVSSIVSKQCEIAYKTLPHPTGMHLPPFGTKQTMQASRLY